MFKKQYFYLLLILLFTIVIRLYKLDWLPGEWFGDISNVDEYMDQIFAGARPFYFFQSPGPLYHYLIFPLVLLVKNQGFLTYKIASVLVSFLGLIATYLFIWQAFPFKLAVITVLTMSWSFWYLVWSRLGNSQIAIPVVFSLFSYFFARYLKSSNFKDVIIAAVVASLGWYLYPQTFVFAPALFIFYSGVIFFSKRQLIYKVKEWLVVVLAMIIMILPFISIMQHQKDNFGASGYIGQKLLPAATMSRDKVIAGFKDNLIKTALMLHVRGDGTFRVNVPFKPQLDRISGIFFLFGFVYLLINRKKWIWLCYFLFMIPVLILPSISPILPDGEVPSSSRTIAITPIIYVMVAAGFLWLHQILVKAVPKLRKVIIILFVMTFILMIYNNLKQYFIDYPLVLPNKNTSFSQTIGQFIRELPSDVKIHQISCCWADAGQPEPKGIIAEAKNRQISFFQAHDNQKPFDCNDLLSDIQQQKKMFFIIAPNLFSEQSKLKACLPSGKESLIQKNGFDVAWTYSFGF